MEVNPLSAYGSSYWKEALLHSQRSGKVSEEFMAIFYKELLKQSFKPFENEENSGTGAFGSDLFLEKLALELARNKNFSPLQLFPGKTENAK